MKRIVFVLAILGSVATMTGQNSNKNKKLSFEKRVDLLVSKMTLDEKISQMKYLSPAIDRLSIPAYNWWNECLHGVAYNGPATCFPQAIGMAATWDLELIGKEADMISTEARAKFYDGQINKKYNHFGGLPGLNFWSPNINIFRDPRWGRGQETYGEDPFLTSRVAIGFIKGIQGKDKKYFKAIATPKHFAVHSGPESSRHGFNAVASRRDLFETYLPAFEAAFKEGGAYSVMSAYSGYEGKPCSANELLLKDILRDKWGFSGFVVSDCGAIGDIYQGHKLTTDKALACAMAVKAGTDLDCGDEYANLKEAVAKKYITEKEIDLSVKRLFLARMKLGLFDDPSLVPYSSIQVSNYDKAETRQFAREVARKSFVLLKNDRLLPLEKEQYKKIAVIGPYINNKSTLLGNYHAVPSKTVTFLEGVIQAVGWEKVLSSEGIVPYDNREDLMQHPYDIVGHSEVSDFYKKTLHDQAIDMAKQSDVILAFMGLSPTLEGEENAVVTKGFARGDRTSINLPEEQTQLLKELKATGKPIVLVLTGGSAIAINWENENIPAIMQSWYPGEEGGNAVADVLFGIESPAGRLPFTNYKSDADLPAFDDYQMKGRTYRYFKGQALYPFGHGLTYTKFDYNNIKVSKKVISDKENINISLDLTNSGKSDSDEVVQLYVKSISSKREQPNKSLRGFQRLNIKKGETKKVTITLNGNDLRTYDETKGAYSVEAGQYEIQIGASSEDIRLKETITLTN